MKEYMVVLGREPELAVAELAAVAKRLALPFAFSSINTEIAVVRGEYTPQFLNMLAGTVKVAEVLGETATGRASLISFLSDKVEEGERREFGLSWYGAKPPRWLLAVGLELKKLLREQAGHVRFVTSREAALSSVVVKKNKLLPPVGYDFVLVPRGEQVLVGRTVWVQDFEAWSQRDYGRPERDARVGMLPPKLARLMLNLAQVPEGGGVLDPFCGSGTVLQEAALMGYRHLVGVDADAKGIERTRANFAWLKNRQPQLPQPALMVSDVRKLPTLLHGTTFEAIVTEPYLGPPLRGREDVRRLEQIQRELTELYRDSLKTLVHMLKLGGRIVMVWPIIKPGRGELALPLMAELKKLGLVLVDALPKEAPPEWRTIRGTLLYAR
ncbi:MAG: DNA methyltransferase, partial [Candidatus Veblenbacteria bacterium]|nr:DNA methyltransferase [Candidatus Veblenbacteria bacterium]